MLVSMHSGRGSAKHNDHNETKKSKSNINPELTHLNQVYTVMDDDENEVYYSCEEGEKLFYQSFFQKTLEKQNEKYRSKGQYGRVRDMEQWMKASQHGASETIYQIGDKDKHPDNELLLECYDEFSEWKQERFKDIYILISASAHFDESTPHIHERGIWVWYDDEGLPQPGIKRALKEAGVPLPKPGEPEGKDNYRKEVVDRECREKWQEICISKGLSIETKPKDRQVGHMGHVAYREYASAMDEVNTLENDLKAQISILGKQRQDLQAKSQKLEIEAKTKAETMARSMAADILAKEREKDRQEREAVRREQARRQAELDRQQAELDKKQAEVDARMKKVTQIEKATNDGTQANSQKSDYARNYQNIADWM